jgi:predicted DsbA family dithiol-disulfide isomerase
MTVIEAFADVWCPFAHVGLRAVVRRRHELGRDDAVLRIRAWPLELVNGQPQDVDKTRRHIEDLRAQCAPDMFRGFDPSTFPPTSLPALALAAAAYGRDDRTGEAVSFALRDALFEEGKDVSDPEVLRAIADRHGIAEVSSANRRSVHDDWHAGQQRGVQGSPHFFCGDTSAFCPSLDIQKGDGGHVDVKPDPAALDAFLTACLG